MKGVQFYQKTLMYQICLTLLHVYNIIKML